MKHRQFAHEPDGAWIIALWKAIYGGDHVEQIAAQAITALTPFLDRGNAIKVTDQQTHESLDALGLTPVEYKVQSESQKDEDTVLPSLRYPKLGTEVPLHCFKNAKGQTICVPILSASTY